MTTGGGRANDHSLKIISLCYDLIEKGRRTAGGRPAAWLAVQCASAQKLSTRRRGAQNFPLFGRQDAFLPFIWNRVPERWPAKSSTSSNPAAHERAVDIRIRASKLALLALCEKGSSHNRSPRVPAGPLPRRFESPECFMYVNSERENGR